jgi:FKBP-type peptidyl-prolyl cis-trans isomerase FkpA
MRLAIMRLAVLLCLVGTPLFAQTAVPAKQTSPMTEDQKTVYALGMVLGKQIGLFNLDRAELDLVKSGLADSILGVPPKVNIDVYGPKIQPLATARHGAAVAILKKKGITYLAHAETEPGAVKLPSGVIYTEIKAGTGANPAATDTVKVNYRGTFVDGNEFDNSAKHGGAATFPLNGVVKCWGEGVQKMKSGGKAKLVCPANTAYGDNSPPNIPPGSVLIFEIELLSVGVQ